MISRWSLLGAALLLGLVFAPVLASPVPAGLGAAPYFSANVRVSSSPVAYLNSNGPLALALAPNGTLYAAFSGYTGTGTGMDIYVTKSTDRGLAWGKPVKVNDDTGGADQLWPSMAVDANGYVYLTWVDGRNVGIGWSNDIYFAKSTDGGITFTAPNVRVNDGTGNVAQTSPSIAVDSTGRVEVLWSDPRSGAKGNDIYFSNSTNGGTTFLAPAIIVNDDAGTAAQVNPVVRVGPGNVLNAVWEDARNTITRGRDVYFSNSTNGGATWSANKLVNDDTTAYDQRNPTLAVAPDGTAYAAWEDSRTSPISGADIYFAKLTPGAATFWGNIRVDHDAGYAWQVGPTMALTPAGYPVVAWTDARNSESYFDVYATWTLDGGASFLPEQLVHDTVGYSQQLSPALAVAQDSTIYALWSDYRDGFSPQVYSSSHDPVGPSANFVAPTGTEDQDVSFADASSDNIAIAQWRWDFGDGTTASGRTPVHRYADPGTYTVTLTVTDRSGNVATKTSAVTIADATAPTPVATWPTDALANTTLVFDGTGSKDNVGVTRYRWDFGDGSTAEGAVALHNYASQGTYQVTLTTWDGAGNTQATTTSLAVAAGPDTGAEVRTLQNTVAFATVGFGIGAVVLFLLGFLLGRRRPPVGAMDQGEVGAPRGPPPPGP